MRPPINGFWGKLRRDEAGEVVAWHPLEHHCADVAAVMEALLQIRNIRHRLARLAGKDDLTAREIARLCVLTALHDLGKANLGFQAKGVLELGTAAGHVGEALALLFRGTAEYREPLQLSVLQHWGDATGELLAASVSHHGRPLGENLPPFQHSWWQARGGRDPKEELGALVRAARGWFPLAFQSGEPLPDSTPFQHAFAGLVMLADWIGSDAHQSAFPSCAKTRPSRHRRKNCAYRNQAKTLAREQVTRRPPTLDCGSTIWTRRERKRSRFYLNIGVARVTAFRVPHTATTADR